MSDARFKVTYSPEGVDPIVWEVDLLDSVKASEMIALKKVSGIANVNEFLHGIMTMDFEALKGLLWLLLHRNLSTRSSWDELDFTLGEIRIDYVDDLTDEQLMRKLLAREETGTLNEAGQARLTELREAGVMPEVDDPKA